MRDCALLKEKPGRLPFFPKGKWGVVPAFPGSRTGVVPVFSLDWSDDPAITTIFEKIECDRHEYFGRRIECKFVLDFDRSWALQFDPDSGPLPRIYEGAVPPF